MDASLLAVSFEPNEKARAAVAAELGGCGEAVYLPPLDDAARREALRNATALLSRNTGTELRDGEPALLRNARLVQFMSAGVDFVPLRDLPDTVPVATNGGAYAEPMAEHAAAMALAAAKRLLPEHAALARGEFNQFKPNRMLAGGVCGILGFGGIGTATARLMRALGMRVHAIRRSVPADAPRAARGLDRHARPLGRAARRRGRARGQPAADAQDAGPDRRARARTDEAGRHPREPGARRDPGRARRSTRTCGRGPPSPPASTRGGSSRCGTARSAWTIPSSPCRT